MTEPDRHTMRCNDCGCVDWMVTEPGHELTLDDHLQWLEENGWERRHGEDYCRDCHYEEGVLHVHYKVNLGRVSRAA